MSTGGGTDFLIGEWAGQVQADTLEPEGMGLRSNVSPVLEGCGIMEKVSAIGQNSAWEAFRVRTYEATRDRWVEYRLDSRWPILQRLEAEVPPAGAPWVFQTPGEELVDGALRVTMNRAVSGSVTWAEERYNAELSHWEPSPGVAFTTRLGAAPQGGYPPYSPPFPGDPPGVRLGPPSRPGSGARVFPTFLCLGPDKSQVRAGKEHGCYVGGPKQCGFPGFAGNQTIGGTYAEEAQGRRDRV